MGPRLLSIWGCNYVTPLQDLRFKLSIGIVSWISMQKQGSSTCAINGRGDDLKQ